PFVGEGRGEQAASSNHVAFRSYRFAGWYSRTNSSRVAVDDVVVRGEEKAAGAAGRVAHALARPRRDAVDHRGDQRTRREVLASAALGVLRVLLQQALVGVALHIGAHRRPVLGVDQVDDHAPQLSGVLELVLRPTEDQPERALLVAEPFERMAGSDRTTHRRRARAAAA